jgi:excisionase family DNA binding protein
MVRIHAGSIERYLDRKRNPDPIPEPGECEVREPHTSRTDRIAQRAIRDFLELLCSRADSTPFRTPLWLTLDQAADYSGLPAQILREMVIAGKLEAMDVGRRRGGKWRIRRLSLERIESPRPVCGLLE